MGSEAKHRNRTRASNKVANDSSIANSATPTSGKHLDANTAKRLAIGYCLFHFPTLYTAGVPRACASPNDRNWVVPIVLASPVHGILGEVGELKINGQSREVTGTSRAEVVAAGEKCSGSRMPRAFPLFSQTQDDTCTLACLRMILVYEGLNVSENELEDRTNKQPGGVDIEDLRLLAESFGLNAEIKRLDLPAIADCLRQDLFPIVFLNRTLPSRPTPELKSCLANRNCSCSDTDQDHSDLRRPS